MRFTLLKKYYEWRFRRRMKFALSLLGVLEELMKNAGISRQARRFFWRSMADDGDRQKAINYLIKEAKLDDKFVMPKMP